MATTALPVSVHPSQDDSTLSPLLSLPKELRLEIWRNTTTSPSSPPILHITQGHTTPLARPSHAQPSHRQHRRFQTIVKTSFERPLSTPINPSLLTTNSLIYHDALPLLYATTTFQPAAMFDAFLSSLSAYAPHCIKTVRLPMDDFISSERSLSWAVLCAQVASLPSLGVVEVVWRCGVDGAQGRRARRLVRPLLKVRARKVVVSDEAVGVQEVLAEVEREVDAEKRGRARTGCAEGRDGGVVGASGDAENDEWDMLSVWSFESASQGAFSQLITGATRSGSDRDDETALLLDCDNWEVVDLWRCEDDASDE